MAEIKLIATDLDGTFLLNHNTPHPDNLRALLKCKEHGIAFCACTGRNRRGVLPILKQVPFDRYCVINNGAAIYDMETDSLRYRNRFDPQIAYEVLALCAQYPHAQINVSSTDKTHLLEDRVRSERRAVFEQRSKVDPLWAEMMVFHKSLDEMVEACKDDMQRINLSLNILQAGLLTDVYEKMSAITGVEVTSSMPGNMEIMPKDGTKGEALSILADIYEAEPQNVMSFGDNYNDIHMILWAGTGVAMGNADERLKSIADYVTDTNINAGVAKAIEKIVFKERT